MTDIKYTKDGKKVAVIGKLNNTEWIVQEIFVADGNEFPAGDNFVTVGLLDEPATTYQMNEKSRLEAKCVQLKEQITKLETDAKNASTKRNASKLLSKVYDAYDNIDVTQLEQMVNFVTGNITHIVIKQYSSYSIQEFNDKIIDLDGNRIDGLKLVSLFGTYNDGNRYQNYTTLSLDWKINTYRDCSGCWYDIYPCTSHEQAVSTLDDLIANDDANQSNIDMKKKYNLSNPSDEKIHEYYERQMIILEDRLKSSSNTTDKINDEIAKLLKVL